MITVVALLALVSVCSARQLSTLSSGWASYRPPSRTSEVNIYGSYGSQYGVNHHHLSKIVSATCSAPPSSIEVCLSEVFSSIEIGITKIVSELKIHEVSIKYNMHHEHTLLTSEVSFVYDVEAIAKSVKLVVNENYYALYEQLEALIAEKEDIYAAYAALEAQLIDIQAREKIVVEEEYEIVEQFLSIKYAKWSVYSAISAIIYEKLAVQEEVVEVQYVVEYLNEQVEKIYGKISQLNKRQKWLISWQDKLYVDINEFEVQVRRFKGFESGLYAQEKQLYIEQERLLSEAEAVEIALEKLRAEYEYIGKEVVYIQAYEYNIEEIYYYIKQEKKIFISAYEQFSCEDSLLYYEACASSSPSSSSSAAAPAAAAAGTTGKKASATAGAATATAGKAAFVGGPSSNKKATAS